MIKKCIFCNNDYEVTRGCLLKKSKYCSNECNKNYWLKIGNKSGKFMGNKIALGKKIKLTQTLSDFQRQFIIGTLLGDASIDLSRKGSASLRFQHTEKNLDYVLMKSKILKNFILREKPTFCAARESKPINGIRINTKVSYVNSTVTHQDLEEYNTLFYIRNGNKRVKIFQEKLSDMITPVSLLFWYMDDGTLSQNHNFINLSTNNFSYEENIRIQHMFKEKFKIDTQVYLIKNQGNYHIRFNKKDVLKFMSILQPLKEFIPPSMSYKFTFMRQVTVNPPHQ
jgi:hypothetical protein